MAKNNNKQKGQKREDKAVMDEGLASAKTDKTGESQDERKAVSWTNDDNEEDNTNASAAVAKIPARQTDDHVDYLPDATVEEEDQKESAMIDEVPEMVEEDIFRFWHMLPWMQRKEIAQRHGYKKIGEFEEYMSMQQALHDEQQQQQQARSSSGPSSSPTTTRSSVHQSYDNSLAFPELYTVDKKPASLKNELEEDEDEAESDTEEDKDKVNDTNSENNEDEADSDSVLLKFPDEILHKIFSFLPVTLYGTKLAYVTAHPHWKRLTRSEHTMKILCERVYLQQARKKQLRVAKFQHSYRFMLYQRPRVQAGGGVYVLRFGRVKPIQRDMWTEVPVGAILETVYYRYLYFEENGSCLYALTTVPPHDMLKRFHIVLLQSSQETPPSALVSQFSNTTTTNNNITKQKPSKKLTKAERERKATELDTRVVWGSYTIQKDKLTVTAKQSWNTVQFVLKIVAHNETPASEHTYLQDNDNSIQQTSKDTTAATNATAAIPSPKPASTTKAISPEEVPRPSVATEEDEYVNAKSTYRVSPNGRFGILKMEQHRSSASGNFDDQDVTYYDEQNNPHVFHHSDVVNYDVEVDKVFRFIPDVRF